MYTVPPSLRFGISYFLSPDEHQSSGRIKDTTSLSDEAATRRSLFEIYVFCTVPRLSRSTGFYIGFTSTVSRTREKKNERVINAITRQRWTTRLIRRELRNGYNKTGLVRLSTQNFESCTSSVVVTTTVMTSQHQLIEFSTGDRVLYRERREKRQESSVVPICEFEGGGEGGRLRTSVTTCNTSTCAPQITAL